MRKNKSSPNTIDGCAFCAIVRGNAPADILCRTAHYIVLRDIEPQAPIHLLVIPTAHHERLSGFVEDERRKRVGELLRIAARYGHELAPQGFRVLINEGDKGHQTVKHVHIHVLGGRPLGWPPG